MPAANDVSHALSRIRGFLAPKQDAERAVRDIRLGLERVVRVVPDLQEWQGVHVGGTNGKGSICAFLSGLFTLAGIGYGRYVSPAFPDRHHGVTINGRYVNPRVYDVETRIVENIYTRALRGWRFATAENPGPLSPFELETATAFRIFNKMKVPYGIVEVGMGGATDATNVMRRKAVTIISKIDLDHQEYLGRTIEDIAKVKAGIMRPGVPCIVDHTNSNEVIRVLRKHASSIGAQISLTWKAEPFLSTLDNDVWKLEDYQKQNLLCAALAFRHLFPQKEINLDRLLAMEPYLPGRMEHVEIDKLTSGRYQAPVLVDAAHNLNGVQALSRHVEAHIRSDSKPITWVMGMSSSKSKPFTEMIECLVRPQDNVAFIEYDQGPNEPPATPAPIGRDIVQSVVSTDDQVYNGKPTVAEAIQWAAQKAEPGHLIFTGSLYLIRDFYKLDGIQRFREMRTRRPGSAQLWRLNRLWKKQPLTKEEFVQFKRAKWHLQLGLTNAAVKKINDEKRASSANDSVGSELETPTEPTRAAPEDLLSSGDSIKETPPSSPELTSEISISSIQEGQESTESSVDDSSTNARDKLLTPAFMELTKLRIAANHHRKSLKQYRALEKVILEDIDHESQQNPSPTNETLTRLHEERIRIAGHVSHHKEASERTMSEIRLHPDPIWNDTPISSSSDPQPTDPAFDELSKLRATAKHHRAYSMQYKRAVNTIKKDMAAQLLDQQPQHEDVVTTNNNNNLQQHITFLEQQAENHQARLEAAIKQLRSHPDAPLVYGILYQEIFGREFAEGKLFTPFSQRTELDPAAVPSAKDADAAARNREERRRRKNKHAVSTEEESDEGTDFWGRKLDPNETGPVATAKSEGSRFSE